MRIDTKLVDSIVAKTADDLLQTSCTPCLMTFADLYSFLNDAEKGFVKELLRQKPSDFGITEPYLGIEDTATHIVAVKNQIARYDGKEVVLNTQYLPQTVHEAYERLKQDYTSRTGKTLLVGSGYRSAARQAVNFVRWLQYYGYNFKKTLGYVSIPGYSQHSLAAHTAIDFITQEGIGVFDEPPFGRFDETPEYAWLLKNASSYKFALPFAKNNTSNSQFEPWHWQYVG